MLFAINDFTFLCVCMPCRDVAAFELCSITLSFHCFLFLLLSFLCGGHSMQLQTRDVDCGFAAIKDTCSLCACARVRVFVCLVLFVVIPRSTCHG